MDLVVATAGDQDSDELGAVPAARRQQCRVRVEVLEVAGSDDLLEGKEREL